MKRACIFLSALVLLLSLCPGALADKKEPEPIPAVPRESVTPTPAGVHHYMLICVDRWNAEMKSQWTADTNEWYKHTDGLMLLTVDEFNQRIMLTSFIRDMLIQRPDGKYGRINNFLDSGGWAYQNKKNEYEGIQALVDTVSTHFDLNIDKFIVVDMRQVERIIDAVGGVDVEITDREATYLTNYSLSASSTSPSLSPGRGGVYHFTGHAAVIYMRIRKLETRPYAHADGKVYTDHQDYGRTYRDRVVLSTIADSLKDISYDDAMKLLDVVLANIVYTNMTTDDVTTAFSLAMQLKGTPVEQIRMPVSNPTKKNGEGAWYEVSPTEENFSRGGYSYCEFSYDGMATKQIDFEMNRAALHDFLFGWTVVDDE